MMRYFPLALLSLIIAGCGDGPPPADADKGVVADTVAPPPITEGHQKLYLQDGGHMEGELHEGKRVGPWASYFVNGGIRSRITYVDGVEEGPTEVFHSTGMPYYTGAYHKGKNVGEWIFYDQQGTELKRVRYDSTGVLLK